MLMRCFTKLVRRSIMSHIIICLILYQCTQVHGLATDVRLSGNFSEMFKPYEGAIEVLINDTWGSISRHGVDTITAKTICKQLGYGFTGFLVMRFSYTGVPLLNSLSCVGNETSVKECLQQPNSFLGQKFDAPGVHCFEQEFSELRLTGGERPNNGQVIVKMDGRWGMLCGDHSWVGMAHPAIDLVICRTLGYQRVFNQFTSASTDIEISWLDIDNIDCIGNETHLNQCYIKEGTIYQPRCYRSHKVSCITELGEFCTSDVICTGVTNAVCVDDKCECKYGYTNNGASACTECDADYYGRKCLQVCDCELNNVNFTMTNRSCDAITGSCACKSNWTGSRCDIDSTIAKLGEFCSSDVLCTAVTNAVCVDDQCECRYGYTNYGTSACTECDDDYHGRNCSQVCDCQLNNVNFTMTNRSCDVITGSCACKTNWTGSRCDIDSTVVLISGESTDSQMLIIIISSSTAGCILLAVIITVCICKYRKSGIKGSETPTQIEMKNAPETGRKGHRELAPAMTSGDRTEYNTIDDSKLGVIINAAVEYDLHPDLLEKTNGKTDDEDGYDSGGYLKPAHLNTKTSYDYAYAVKQLETDEHGYLKMNNEKRQLPAVPTDKQIESPYEGLKGSRQGEHDYSKMSEKK